VTLGLRSAKHQFWIRHPGRRAPRGVSGRQLWMLRDGKPAVGGRARAPSRLHTARQLPTGRLPLRMPPCRRFFASDWMNIPFFDFDKADLDQVPGSLPQPMPVAPIHAAHACFPSGHTDNPQLDNLRRTSSWKFTKTCQRPRGNRAPESSIFPLQKSLAPAITDLFSRSTLPPLPSPSSSY